ncbi:MAG: magnesium transporter [Clostridium sp.]|nr:MAG: magnesium transporter [Clostridium sp.]
MLLKVSAIISASLVLAMTLSSLIGTIFPIFLNKIHVDPAVASGPFITTFNDIVAVVVYYGLTAILFF